MWKAFPFHDVIMIYNAGIILWMHPANKRWRYIVTSSLIGWAHTQNDPDTGIFIIGEHLIDLLTKPLYIYRKISNIRCTKSQNLNDSHPVLKLSLPNPLEPGVKSRMKM